MQEPNRQHLLDKKIFIAYFHLFAIFTLKLPGKYSNLRWNIIFAALRITKKNSYFLDLALVKVWIVFQPRLRFVFHQVTTPKWSWHLQIKNFGEKQVIQNLHVIVTTWKEAREYEYNYKQIALLCYSASHTIPDRSNSGLQSNLRCFDFWQFLSYNSCCQNTSSEKDN